jgi:two-component system, OmpR family, sensor histidine kinase SenX3
MGDVRTYRSLPILLVIIGSFALLGLLGWLQYHWLNQLSSDERVRMSSVLETSVTRFCEDFDRELARAWVAFRMNGATLRQENLANFSERYDHWVKQSPHPRLVSALYLVTEDGKGELQVEQFHPSDRTFVPSTAPAELQSIRQKLEKQRQGLWHPARHVMPFFPGVLADTPLLLIPVVPLPEEISHPLSPVSADRSPRQTITFKLAESDTFSYLVVRLDSEYIQREFIPELARRYFGREGQAAEYQLSIIRKDDPTKVVYSTASLPLTTSEADASGTMLTLRPKLVENFAFEFYSPISADRLVTGGLKGHHLRSGGRSGGRPIISGMTAGISAGVVEGRPKFSVINAASSGVFVAHVPPPLPPEEDTGSWQLLVNHRAGSLGEAVEKLRRQNLFVSFSILLLLAVSAVLIYVSSHRARRLAHQQIEFVAGVSHELRVPVSVVCLTSANLADGLIREPGQVENYGHLIHNAGRRLAQSIEQVLDFAGAEMIRRPYQFDEVEVEALIASALDACRAEWQSAGFEVKTTIAESLPKVWGDRTALTSALQNLIINAVKYGGESRQLEIGCQLIRRPRTKPWTRRRGDEVQISVEDHGIGIEPGERKRIFEPFKRGAAAASAQIPGSGLGLYLVRRIVAAHGGEVTVQSVPGHGSIFTLHLPAAAPLAR